MPRPGEHVEIAPGIAIGIAPDGTASIQAQGPERPPAEVVFGAVGELREKLLRQVAFLTSWMEAATQPQERRLVVVPGGALPRPPGNGHG